MSDRDPVLIAHDVATRARAPRVKKTERHAYVPADGVTIVEGTATVVCRSCGKPEAAHWSHAAKRGRPRRNTPPKRTHNVTIDAEAFDRLSQQQASLVATFGFMPTLSQVVLYIIKQATDTTRTDNAVNDVLDDELGGGEYGR